MDAGETEIRIPASDEGNEIYLRSLAYEVEKVLLSEQSTWPELFRGLWFRASDRDLCEWDRGAVADKGRRQDITRLRLLDGCGTRWRACHRPTGRRPPRSRQSKKTPLAPRSPCWARICYYLWNFQFDTGLVAIKVWPRQVRNEGWRRILSAWWLGNEGGSSVY